MVKATRNAPNTSVALQASDQFSQIAQETGGVLRVQIGLSQAGLVEIVDNDGTGRACRHCEWSSPGHLCNDHIRDHHKLATSSTTHKVLAKTSARPAVTV